MMSAEGGADKNVKSLVSTCCPPPPRHPQHHLSKLAPRGTHPLGHSSLCFGRREPQHQAARAASTPPLSRHQASLFLWQAPAAQRARDHSGSQASPGWHSFPLPSGASSSSLTIALVLPGMGTPHMRALRQAQAQWPAPAGLRGQAAMSQCLIPPAGR